MIIEEWDELNLKAVEKQALAIKEFYRKKGYYRCEVNFRLQRPPDKKDVDIEYIIQEGERARVSSIVLAGDKAFPDQQILKRLALKVGGFYEEEKILTAVKGLERFFRKSGYSGARTDFQSRYLPEMNEIEVAVNIEEGEPLGKKVKVEKITFKGEQRHKFKGPQEADAHREELLRGYPGRGYGCNRVSLQKEWLSISKGCGEGCNSQ